MKKCLGVLFLIIFALTLPFILADSVAAQGGFKKFEDWEDYPTGDFVSDDKWVVHDRCSGENIADVSIEDDGSGNNRLKFTYNEATPDRSCWLMINDCPERIVGIKADVTIDACEDNQDCRGRVAWHRGITLEDDFYTWEQVQVQPNRFENDDGYIAAVTSVLDQNDDYEWIRDAYWARTYSPKEIIGETFTVSALFDKPDQVTVTVDGEDTITYKFEEKMGDPIELFKAIGMRVQNGTDWNGDPRVTNADFVVYFDNIYIKTKGSCDNKKPQAKVIDPKKNVPLDTCTVHITFNEPMDTCCSNFDASGDWPIGDTDWSDDQKTFSIERSNCGTELPDNTKIEFVVNPDGTGFMDLKGNEAKKKKLTIKTVKEQP